MTNYKGSFYNAIRSGCISSAKIVAPHIYDLMKSEIDQTDRSSWAKPSVVDIGCGEGHWAKAFEDLGCRAIGVDGDYVADPIVEFVAADLSKSIPLDDLDASYDLAISLEVAEHLRESRADAFVDEFCSLSDNLLFSAAIPNQGGVDHFNEQWFSSYWLPKFEKNGYKASGILRFNFWEDENVEWWYKQNLMFITKNPSNYPSLYSAEYSKPIDIIHPILWDSRK